MKRFILFVISVIIVISFVTPTATIAASKSTYYTVSGTNNVSPGVYQGVPNGKSKIVLKEKMYTLKETAKPPMKIEDMNVFYVKGRLAKKNDDPWGLNTLPIQEVESVGNDLYIAKFLFSAAYYGSCGGGGADILEIYKRNSKGKQSKITNDKVSSNTTDTFSINGKHIYYAKVVNEALSNYTIVKATLEGKKKQTLKKGVDDFWVNGKSIYYIDNNALYKMDLNGKNNKKLSKLKAKLYGNSGCDGGNYSISNNGLSVSDYSSEAQYFIDYSTGNVQKLKVNVDIQDVDVKKKRLVATTWNGENYTYNLYDVKGKKLKKIKTMDDSINYQSIKIDAKKGEFYYVKGTKLYLIKY
ncbi:hypothetical protein ACIQZM_11205 [Peribacillus sp. NPDC097206]|uniref:hypothetical protein n=1 Tax=unclassified Peribacillus TaxID=2675266 RepID=UPI0037F37DCC